MIIKDLKNCEEFIAGDGTIFRELLNPDKLDLAIRYSLGEAVVKAGVSSKPHRLKTSEVYFITQGEGIMYVDAKSAEVRAGQAIYIVPGAKQYIKNIGKSDLKFLCIVDPAWRSEDEEIL